MITEAKFSFNKKLAGLIKLAKSTKVESSMASALLLCLAFSHSVYSPLAQADEIKLNDIQVIGSHNSYKRPLNPKIHDLIAQHDAKAAASIDYSHPTLSKQLQLGLRHFEIDIVKDPSGGRFAFPEGEKLTQQKIVTPTERELLGQPGFKVIHVPDLDFSSHCVLFQACLNELVDFSNKHPKHLPIVILMNLKESNTKWINATPILSFEAEDYAELDQVLMKTFGDKLITPDEIKGEYKTLEQAILTQGWPSLKDSRGRFLFILDGKAPQLAIYRDGHQSLNNRALFASYAEGEPEAAFMVRNDPVKNIAEIQQLIKKGYLVRTRADGGAGTRSNTADVKLRTEMAIASGAQIISTDFYPGAPQILPSGFVVSFEQGELCRYAQKVRKEKCELVD